jgi:hypothetical protein
MSAKYSKGEFTQAAYMQFGKDWNDMLKSLGGYPKLPYNEKTKEIEFISIKSFNNIDKKSIYDRTMEWAAETFGSLSYVLHYSNPENGKIILKGWFEIYYKTDVETFWTAKKEKASSVKTNFTYIFTIKDNKLKMEVININFEYYIPSSMVSNLYTPPTTYERPIILLYPITDSESIEWKGRLDLLNKINIQINQYFTSLENYINNKAPDYNF